jgi:hypothetical protein
MFICIQVIYRICVLVSRRSYQFHPLNVQNTDMVPATLSITCDILSVTNATRLTADMIRLCKKEPVASSWFSWCPLCPSSVGTAISEPILCTRFTLQVPNLISLFVYLRLFIWRPRPCPRPFVTFRNKLISHGDSVSPTLNSQVEGLPIVGCPRLHIQYIRGYPPSPPYRTWWRAMPWWRGARINDSKIL